MGCGPRHGWQRGTGGRGRTGRAASRRRATRLPWRLARRSRPGRCRRSGQTSTSSPMPRRRRTRETRSCCPVLPGAGDTVVAISAVAGKPQPRGGEGIGVWVVGRAYTGLGRNVGGSGCGCLHLRRCDGGSGLCHGDEGQQRHLPHGHGGEEEGGGSHFLVFFFLPAKTDFFVERSEVQRFRAARAGGCGREALGDSLYALEALPAADGEGRLTILLRPYTSYQPA